MAAPTVKLLDGSKIPVVGLGTWQVSDEAELETALNTSLENGYRHIDTALAYRNEHIIGKVLQKWFSAGKLKREDVFITTKLPFGGTHPDRVEKFMKKSLENLQLDYVDLYLIHFPICTKPQANPRDPMVPEPTDHVAVWKKLEEQVDAGLTRTIGLSNFNIQQIDRILKNCRIKPASLQVENHILLPQNELVKFAQDNGMVVIAYSPLSSPGIARFHKRHGVETKETPNLLTNPTVKSIGEKHKKSTAQIALKFLIQRNIVVIPKSVTVNRIKENIDLFNFTLDENDMTVLKGLEVGEEARVCDFSFSKLMVEHPEFPFPKKNN